MKILEDMQDELDIDISDINNDKITDLDKDNAVDK